MCSTKSTFVFNNIRRSTKLAVLCGCHPPKEAQLALVVSLQVSAHERKKQCLQTFLDKLMKELSATTMKKLISSAESILNHTCTKEGHHQKWQPNQKQKKQNMSQQRTELCSLSLLSDFREEKPIVLFFVSETFVWCHLADESLSDLCCPHSLNCDDTNQQCNTLKIVAACHLFKKMPCMCLDNIWQSGLAENKCKCTAAVCGFILNPKETEKKWENWEHKKTTTANQKTEDFWNLVLDDVVGTHCKCTPLWHFWAQEQTPASCHMGTVFHSVPFSTTSRQQSHGNGATSGAAHCPLSLFLQEALNSFSTCLATSDRVGGFPIESTMGKFWSWCHRCPLQGRDTLLQCPPGSHSRTEFVWNPCGAEVDTSDKPICTSMNSAPTPVDLTPVNQAWTMCLLDLEWTGLANN